MTIDEAIAKYKEKSEYFKKTTNVAYALELEQLAEWLERLKAYESDEFTSGLQKLAYQQGYSKAESDYFENTQIDRESSYKIGYEVGYNKAIDDFSKVLKSNEFQKYNLDFVFETSRDLSYSECINAFEDYVDLLAEQLKEGGESE